MDDHGEAESEAGEEEEKSTTSKEHIKLGVEVPESAKVQEMRHECTKT